VSKLKSNIINHIIEIEGGYVNDPSDSGGETNYGITKKVARSYGYIGEMKDLPRQVAFNIYSAEYWDKLKLDQIEEKSPAIAKELADTAINCGVSFAAKSLQDWLNTLNNKGELYDDIVVDGGIGNNTIKACMEYWLLRVDDDGEYVLLTALNSEQVVRYKELSKRYVKNERYTYGWIRNRALISREVTMFA